MQTLDKIGLTYDETWKMVKNELIVQRMNWWFIQSKAMSSIAPQDIREAYQHHLQDNPPYAEWKYRVVSIRADKGDEITAEKAYQLLSQSDKNPNELENLLKNLETPDTKIAISNEFTAKTQDLSEVHKASLENLSPGTYSKPSFSLSRADHKSVYRIFYLIDKTDFPAPSFDAISQELRNNLIQKAIAQESSGYLSKLRKYYGFESDQTVPDDLQPFSLQ
jgi:hypothetical protein